jgi:hypothetical protein
VLNSFPIVRDHDLAACGRFRTRDEVLAKLREIEAGRLAV